MIKAYLYPNLLGYEEWLEDNFTDSPHPIRVEVNLPALPPKQALIVYGTYAEGVARKLFESCKADLLYPNSAISDLLSQLREDIKENDTRVLKDIEEWKPYENASNIELLRRIIFDEDYYLSFVKTFWEVNYVWMPADQDHVHIHITDINER